MARPAINIEYTLLGLVLLGFAIIQLSHSTVSLNTGFLFGLLILVTALVWLAIGLGIRGRMRPHNP